MIKKTFGLSLSVLVAILFIGSIYWWNKNDTDLRSLNTLSSPEAITPQETSETLMPRSITEEEVLERQEVNQEINDDTTWQTYTSNEGEISFEYPRQFFLLDRSKDYKSIYISPREISLNDFTNGYYAPIVISFTDESQGNNMIETLNHKVVDQININGKNALAIFGVTPENPPYYAVDVYAFIFPEQKISIIAANRFAINKSITLRTVAEKIADTLNFK